MRDLWHASERTGDEARERDGDGVGKVPGKLTLTSRIFRVVAAPAAMAPEAALARTEGSTGTPLPDDARSRFEASLGTDLGDVRIHTGPGSADAAAGLGARAFAVGQDVHFGAGQYHPDDPFGMHLLAHEVAHTVQQRSGGAGPQRKATVSEPGDAAEIEADRAADAMVRGQAFAVTGVGAGIARKGDGDGAPAGTGDKAVFVEFTKEGAWDGAAVLAELNKQGAKVPADLAAAIQAGPKETAKYCAALRGRVAAADTDPAKHAELEQIQNALTSRVNELVNATSRSPLQYRQLTEVATWATTYPATGAQPGAPAKDAKAADAQPGADANKGDGDAAAYATTLAGSNPRVRAGDKDVIRTKTDTANDTHAGDESGKPTLAGWTFIHDPFANTVIAVRPDKTGIQYTFQVEAGADGAAPKVTLEKTEELSALRVGMARRQELAAPQREQETAKGRDNRIQGDKDAGAAARKKFKEENPGVAEKWEADTKAWSEKPAKDRGPAPPVPVDAKTKKPYQANDNKTTACPATPTDYYHEAGGAKSDFFPFTPPTSWKSWRTLATNPEGPKLGDVYWLYDLAQKRTAHMGVVKSRVPVSGKEGWETWVVTDGGQGGYDKIQLEQERTRGPFNTKTGIFYSSIAEAGQSKGERKLTGWVDIDAFKADPDEMPTNKKK